MLPEVLPYHLSVRDHFKKHSSVWEFFAAAHTREEQLGAFQTELLKNKSPLRRETDPGVYEQIDLVLDRLGLGQLSVTAWQAADADEFEWNAGIVYLHQEAHLVFCGPIRQQLNDAEMLAVIAHELTHIRLYTALDGELEVVDRIITAIANHPGSEPPYDETARLFKIYAEIYCDRGAYAVLGDSDPIITGLSKIATGLPGENATTPTHPKNFIRARAIRLWQDQGAAADPDIAKMIEGPADLHRLDVFSQSALHTLTREVLLELLQPDWVRTAGVLGLAQQYFPGLSWPGNSDTGVRERLITALENAEPGIHEYFSYLLLDLALADPSLENQLAGQVIAFAEEVRLAAVFEPICKKEMQFGEKKWQQYKQSALAAWHDVRSV